MKVSPYLINDFRFVSALFNFVSPQVHRHIVRFRIPSLATKIPVSLSKATLYSPELVGINVEETLYTLPAGAFKFEKI